MLLALLSVFSAPVLAGDVPKDPKGTGGIVQNTAKVDVPLYAGLNQWDDRLYVEVTIGEKKALLQVVTDTFGIALTDEGAAALGISFKGKSTKTKVDEVTFGELKITDVTIHKLTSDSELPEPEIPEGAPLLGVFGVSAFMDFGWALIPSEGVLRVVPSSESAALLSSIGTAFPYEERHYHKVRLGKGPKSEVGYRTMIVEMEWSGVALKTVVGNNTRNFIYREIGQSSYPYSIKGYTFPSVTLPAAPTFRFGESSAEYRSVSLGGVSYELPVERFGAGPWLMVAEFAAGIGWDFLRTLDMAVDRAAHSLAIRKSSAFKAADYRSTYEAVLKKALEPAPPAEGAPEPTEQQKKDAKLKALKTLAQWYEVDGNFPAAVPLWKDVVGLEPEKCTNWQELGINQRRSLYLEDAVVSLGKAADLYEPYAILPLTERKKLEEDYGKAKAKGEEWSATVPQSHDCNNARGYQAKALLALGRYKDIDAIYPEKMDLTWVLAETAGSSYMLQGKHSEATAAYQQAIAGKRTSNMADRMGLILTNGKSWEYVKAQLDLEPGLLSYFVTGRSILSVGEKLLGKEGLEKELKSIYETRPGNYVVAGLYAEILKGNGKDNTAVLSKAVSQVETELIYRSRSGKAWADYAELLLLQGKTDEARKAADTAVSLAAQDEDVWYTLGTIVAAQGDAAKAGEHRRKAGALGIDNPAYAMLLVR
jgi:tetratricopeptide (TPR) repeat protein